MTYLLKRGDEPQEYPTEERCHIRELLNDERIPEYSIAEARVEPGVTTALHEVTVKEWYRIRAGTGRMQVGDAPPFDVGPGDTVVIPARTPQRITNTGQEDLLFECVCIPRFTPDCYTALD